MKSPYFKPDVHDSTLPLTGGDPSASLACQAFPTTTASPNTAAQVFDPSTNELRLPVCSHVTCAVRKKQDGNVSKRAIPRVWGNDRTWEGLAMDPGDFTRNWL